MWRFFLGASFLLSASFALVRTPAVGAPPQKPAAAPAKAGAKSAGGGPNYFLYGAPTDKYKEITEALAQATLPAGAKAADYCGPENSSFASGAMPGVTTITVLGDGTATQFCGVTADQFATKILAWKKVNATLKTVELLACNIQQTGRVGTRALPKTYVETVAAAVGKKGVTIKALPIGKATKQGVVADKESVSALALKKTPPAFCYVTGQTPGVLDAAMDVLAAETAKTNGDLGKAGQTLAKLQRQAPDKAQSTLTVMSGPLKSLRPILTVVDGKKK
jgi:hypothetical protein